MTPCSLSFAWEVVEALGTPQKEDEVHIRVGLEAEQLHFPVGLPPKPELLHPELGPFDP